MNRGQLRLKNRELLADKATLSEKIKKLEAEIESLREANVKFNNKNQELFTALTERNEQLAKTTAALADVMEKLKSIIDPPNLFAHFIKFAGEKNADIIHDGRKKRVSISSDIDRQLLMTGVPVIITEQNSAIIEVVTTRDNVGAVVVVSKYTEDGVVIIKDEHGAETSVFVSTYIDKEQAPPNSRVLVANGFIVGVVESEDELTNRGTNKYLLAESPTTNFDDIGGLDTELNLIKTEIGDSFEVSKLYDLYEIPKEIHIMLHGLPGNGKTMIAKAIAKTMMDKYGDKISQHASGNFFAIRGTELEIKWVGETEERLRDIFDSASSLAKKANAPVFIFFDDCEAFLLRRGAGISSDVNMGHVTQLATLLDGIKEIRGVNVILATNRIDLIDPAIIRRMNLKLRISEPNKEAATKIFKKLLRNIPLSKKYLDTATFPTLNGDLDAILSQIVNTIIDNLYRDSKENNFIEIIFTDEGSQILKIDQFISGKIISDIVNRAKKIAKDRDKILPETEWPSGITTEDLLEAMKTEFRDNEGLPTTKEMIEEWLRHKGINREVGHTRKLFGEKLGERQIHHQIQ